MDSSQPKALDLSALQAIDIMQVLPDQLADLNEIEVQSDLPREARIAHFLSRIRNPYCFRCGPLIVKTSFGSESTLEDRLRLYLSTL